MPMFPLFMEAHGIRYSIIALVITLWGFLSLRQMDTEQETQRDAQPPPVFHKPRHRKNRRRLITVAVIVLMSGVMLFGAIKFIDATLADTPECEQQIKLECIKDMPEPICPPQHRRVPCPLGAAVGSER